MAAETRVISHEGDQLKKKEIKFFFGELPQDPEVYLISGASLQKVLGRCSTIAAYILILELFEAGNNFCLYSNWELFATSESSVKYIVTIDHKQKAQI